MARGDAQLLKELKIIDQTLLIRSKMQQSITMASDFGRDFVQSFPCAYLSGKTRRRARQWRLHILRPRPQKTWYVRWSRSRLCCWPRFSKRIMAIPDRPLPRVSTLAKPGKTRWQRRRMTPVPVSWSHVNSLCNTLVLSGRHQEHGHDVQQLILDGKVRRVLGARIDNRKINHFIILSSLVRSLKEPDHAVGSVHALLSAGPDAPTPKVRESGHHASVRGKIKTCALDDVFKLEKEGAKQKSVSVDSIVCWGKSLTNALANRLARSALGLVVAGGATADGFGVASVGGSMLRMLKSSMYMLISLKWVMLLMLNSNNKDMLISASKTWDVMCSVRRTWFPRWASSEPCPQ